MYSNIDTGVVRFSNVPICPDTDTVCACILSSTYWVWIQSLYVTNDVNVISKQLRACTEGYFADKEQVVRSTNATLSTCFISVTKKTDVWILNYATKPMHLITINQI